MEVDSLQAPREQILMGQLYGLCRDLSPSSKISVTVKIGLVFPERYLRRTCLKGTCLKGEADAKITRISEVSKLTKRENREK